MICSTRYYLAGYLTTEVPVLFSVAIKMSRHRISIINWPPGSVSVRTIYGSLALLLIEKPTLPAMWVPVPYRSCLIIFV
jgi:hypothetical protein